MLFSSKKHIAKKALATVLISFPCLIIALIFFGLIFLIPGIIFLRLFQTDRILSTPISILLIIGLLIFLILVATSALYLWYFTSKIIHRKIDGKPLQEFVNNDKVFNFIRLFLIKYKVITN